MKNLVEKYLDEAAAFNKEALSQKKRPNIVIANFANKLYSTYIEYSEKAKNVSEDLKPSINSALNFIKLGYNALRKEYPHFLKKID